MELHDGNSGIYAGEDNSGVNFWCMFINFEVWNGGADRARAVARAAAAAGDPTIFFDKREYINIKRASRWSCSSGMATACSPTISTTSPWTLIARIGCFITMVGACHGHDDSNAKQLGGGFFLGKMCRGIRRLVQPHGFRPLHAASTTTCLSV
jgi:hypothetical protein